jgi:DNA modification methylase
LNVKLPDEIVMRRVEDLIPYARNSRTHSPEQVAKLAGAIKEFGWTVPVLVDKDGVIVAGHGRVMAARKLGLDVVPTIVLEHLSEAQKRAYVIADNRLALDAGWDDEMLKVELGELTGEGFDLALTGFSEEEINRLTQSVEVLPPAGDENAIPDVQGDPISRPGDVWILGGHRVVCGDSTDPSSFAKAVNGNIADILFTSPPYALGENIKLSGNKSIKFNQTSISESRKKSLSAYSSHEDSAEEWPSLMSGWWSAAQGSVQDAMFVNVQLLANNKRNLWRWVADRIDHLVDVVTWHKTAAAPQIQQGVLTNAAEWILVFGKQGASRVIPFSSWQGNVTTVYTGPPQRGNEYAAIHAATFPMHLPEWILGTLADKSRSVIDPFLGTGTTLIAAEKLGKTCYGIEIDPRYVDVIVKRWQDYSGKEAVLESTGRTFREEGGAG